MSTLNNNNKIIFPLHPAQENIYFEQILHLDDPFYNIGCYQILEYHVDKDVAQRCWKMLYQHLDALRIMIIEGQENVSPVQYIQQHTHATLHFYDLSNKNNPEKTATTWMSDKFSIPINFLSGETSSVALIKLSENKYYLFLRFHHIVIDGTGIYRLLKYFHKLYHHLVNDIDTSWLSDLPQFNIKAIESNAYLNTQRYEKDKNYWLKKLGGREVARLPSYYKNEHSEEIFFPLSSQLRNLLDAFCVSNKLSPLSVLMSVVHIYFTKILDSSDISIGTVVHGRNKKDDRQVVGMFSNMILITCNILPTSNFRQLTDQLSKEIFASFRHSKFPASHLSRLLKTGVESKADVVVNYEHFRKNKLEENNKVKTVHLSSQREKQPLQIRLIDYDFNDELILKITYSQRYFSPQEAELLGTRLIKLMKYCIKNENFSVAQFPLLLEQEHHTLLHDWNQTDAPYPQDKTLHQMFEAQVAQTPNSIALVFNDEQLTYAELNTRANQLASSLRQKYQTQYQCELQADTLIALYLDRSLEMVVSMLAVLKVGGAYVPISPEYPQARTAFILEDTRTLLVISQQHYFAQLEEWASELPSIPVLLNVDESTLLATFQQDNLPITSVANDLAYVIYTSGTTGQPKGCMVSHQNVCHLIEAQIQCFDARSHKSALQFADYVFDASVFEIFISLLAGHRVIICNDSQRRDPAALSHLMIQNQVELATLPPAILNQMTSDNLDALKTLITAGEAPSLEMLERFSKNRRVFNAYGPTEATVCASAHQFYVGDMATNIGKPLNNTRLYVLDNTKNLVPVGIPGELYIGGAGLARGYLNQTALTSERFIDNPFASATDLAKGYTRLYKTGDLVRRLSDGSLEYMGRNDFQVKIRGYRIELGEIEQALIQLPNIQQAVVIDHEREGNKYLAAYLVLASDEVMVADTLHQTLSAELPHYMLPSTYTQIDAVPLTLNGKLDRHALPEPIWLDDNSYVAPRNALEAQLCTLWEQTLGIEQIGINDNFFRIGGDSIVSIGLITKMRQAGLSVQVKDVFNAPSVAQLAAYLANQQDRQDIINAEQGTLKGDFALLPIQQWFFDTDWAHAHHWNQAFVITIPGDITPVDIESALRELAHQHDMLRIAFYQVDGQWRQSYHETLDERMAPLQQLNISGLNTQQQNQKLTDWQKQFDYEKGPLWCAAHLSGYTDDSARVWFACHHLLIDAVSWRIIADDMRLLLTQQPLAAKSSSYRQWVGAVQKYEQQNQDEISYWQDIMDEPIVLPEPCERSEVHIILPTTQTELLLRDTNHGYHTEINDLLLSALSLALKDTFEQATNHISLEAHGRESIDDSLDVSRTVGWFTTAYPIKLTAYDDIGETIINTKEALRTVPNKGIGYGALRQTGRLTEAKLPPLNFNYLGQLNHQIQSNAEKWWQLSNDSLGVQVSAKNKDELLLNINGAVVDNQLQFWVVSQLSTVQTERFADAFEQAILQIIEQCILAVEAGGITTASDFGLDNLPQSRFKDLQQHYDIEAIYPASSLQQGFIYHHLSQPQDDAYRVQLLLDYSQALDLNKFQQAWTLASLRYPILRTAFDWQGDVLQVITKGPSITADNFRFEDISTLAECDRDAAIIAIQQQDRRQPFNLTRPGLIRFVLIKQSETLYTLLKSEHHSITDGWSGPILLQTVHDYYDVLCQEQMPEVKAETTYLAAQKYLLTQGEETETYWKQEKQHFGEANDINTMLSQQINLNETRQVAEPAEQYLKITDEAYQALKTLCRQLKITLNVALQFAWHKLLTTYSGDEQTIVGTTVSGRNIPVDGIETSVGLYINTLPLAVNWLPEASIVEMLQQIQQRVTELNSYSGISLTDLQKDGERLFHSLFVFENYPIQAQQNNKGIGAQFALRDSVEKVDYPLSVVACEQNNSLLVKLNYSRDWLTSEKAQRLLSQFNQILRHICTAPEGSHQQINLVNKLERQTLLHYWNQTDAPYPQDKTLHQMFEAQVAQTPNSIALVFNDEQLTYAELNTRANQLASSLRQKYQTQYQCELQADTLIALYLDRSLEMVVSMLAVLKVGGAYVPISPEYPQARTAFILEDTRTLLVISQQHYFAQLEEWASELPSIPVLLNVDESTLLATFQQDNLPITSVANDLAYVIYTSGTTGQPKGCMVSHQNVCHLIEAQIQCFDARSHKSALQFADYVFDASVFEIFISLLAGHRVIICNDSQRRDPAALSHLMIQNQVELATLPPAILNQMTSDNLDALKTLITAGEAPSLEMLERFSKNRRVFNAYGPTEATVCASAHQFYVGDMATNIGKPLNNTRLYVLDNTKNLVPVGIPGELYIGGAGLARGYLNQTALTSERFIDNPFASATDLAKGYTRLYKTGDLVRRLSDGSLEYMGRNDFQVKIRGYRIELGEIEQALIQLPNIQQAVVIDHEREGNKYLAAYLVLASDEVMVADTLHQTLSAELPHYMLPSTYTQIDAVPLTLNGKLDRHALPEPIWLDDNSYVAPRNALEAQLCTLWEQTLGIEQIGINDNFFRIGGDSINAIQLTAAARRELSFDIPPAVLFETKTVARLATALNESEVKGGVCMQVIPRGTTNRYPLSFAQERLFFIEEFEQGTHIYHIPLLVKLTVEVQLEPLKQAFDYVIQRHPVLNSVYLRDDEGKLYQQVLTSLVTMRSHLLGGDSALKDTITNEIQQPFELNIEPPIRLHYYQVADQKYLLILFHHIAFDGWSTDIFMRELSTAYQAYCQDIIPKLSALDISYGDYSLWQRQYLKGDVLEQQLAYWCQTLSGYETLLLPTDKPRPKKFDYRGENYNFTLSVELSQQLRELSSTQETTLYVVLLSAFYVTLSTLTGQQDILLGTPSDNRHQAQTQDLIGFFVNSLVLRAEITPQTEIPALIAQIHQVVTTAKLHQELPFERLVEALQVDRDLSRHPLFQVIFGIQNFGQQSQSRSDLPFIDADLGEEESLYSPAKFDLSLFIDDGQTQLQGSFNYAISLFHETTIARFVDIYRRVLKGFVAQPIQLVGDINVLSSVDRHTLLHDWNQTNETYPATTLLSCFFSWVTRQPNTPAVITPYETISYFDMDRKRQALAYSLSSKGVMRGDLVGVLTEKGVPQVTATLGILSLGAAYLPLNVAWPPRRLHDVLQAGAVSYLVLSHEQYNAYQQQAWLNAYQLIVVEDVCEDMVPPKWTTQLPSVRPDEIAYVIFTSGSTGKPKGVIISHRGAMNTIEAVNRRFKIQPQDRVLALSDLSFDLSVFDIFGSLAAGAAVVFPEQSHIQDPHHWVKLVKQYGITLWNSVPQLVQLLVEDGVAEPSMLRSLRVVLMSGDWIPLTLPDQLKKLIPDVEAISLGGATEGSIWSIWYPINTVLLDWNSIPYGQAMPNQQMWVLNKLGHHSSIGSIGEIHIGGVGVAEGYFNDEVRTQAQFIEHPSLGRLYKTGDLGLWNERGYIEFKGRKDFQIKIRGYRVELGEIETLLNEQVSVKQAIVIDREREGNKYLAAYLVLEPGKLLLANVLRETLAATLPDYMLPSTYTQIDAVPITLNGKLDRDALPDPVWLDENSYVAPRNTLETQLCTLWQQVLGVESVGIHDNFFSIGGDSIVAMKLVSKINQEFDSRVSISDLFTHLCISKISELLSAPHDGIVLLKKLSYTLQGLPALLMIHPALAGCEVYHSLATCLSTRFDCYGLENYNLLSENKIGCIHTLANRYIDELSRANMLDNTVYILGWSLGGKIALEMAAILESKGLRKIKVYLLDSFLHENFIVSQNDLGEDSSNKGLAQLLYNRGYDQTHIKKALDNVIFDHQLSNSPLSRELIYTQVILFKACGAFPVDFFGSNKVIEDMIKVTDNNLLSFVKGKLSVHRLDHRHHHDIIEEEAMITEVLFNDLPPLLC